MQIEKGIPIPEPTKTHKLSEMEVGDSFIAHTRSEVSAARIYFRRNNKKMISKKEGEGWRVWRTE